MNRHLSLSLTGLLVTLCVPGCARKLPYEGRSVAQLERMLADPDPTVQVQGAFGLGQKGAEAHTATTALTRALASSNVLVRQQACMALGKVGPLAAQAMPPLLTALTDPEWTVRRQAAVALGQIGPLSAVETPLANCRHDSNSLVRKAAADALAILRNAAEAGKK